MSTDMSEDFILGPYKEPLRPVKKGFGYQGTVSLTREGKIQCHICGEVWDNLAKHIGKKHKITTTEYRKKFEIAYRTKLISEEERIRLKEHQMRKWFSMSKAERTKAIAKARKGMIAFRERIGKKAYSRSHTSSLETKNKRGVCPDQLLTLITTCATKLGHTPTKTEFEEHYGTSRFRKPIERTFGTWNEALKKAKLTPHTKYQGTGEGHGKKYEKEELLEYLSDYYHRTQRLPSASDCLRAFFLHTRFSYDTSVLSQKHVVRRGSLICPSAWADGARTVIPFPYDPILR